MVPKSHKLHRGKLHMQDAVENGDGRHECEISICMLYVYMEGDSEQIEMGEKEN